MRYGRRVQGAASSGRADGAVDAPPWRQLLGVVWSGRTPHLRVRHAQDEPSVVIPLAGQTLRYRTDESAEITCVGHVPFRGTADYVDCSRRPEPASRVCYRCAVVEATFASNLHHAHTRRTAELDPAVAHHLAQPNRLYLAGFRDGSIKIGTSTRSRSGTRLAEQGAWIARYVAETADGRTVRELEDAVTDILGIGQSVSTSRKRKGLVSPTPDDVLLATLDRAAARVASIIEADGVNVDLDGTDSTWRHPMTDAIAGQRIVDYPLALTTGRHDLVLETAIGRLIIARRPEGDDRFVLDPAPLAGRWLDVGDYGSDEIAIQDSLF